MLAMIVGKWLTSSCRRRITTLGSRIAFRWRSRRPLLETLCPPPNLAVYRCASIDSSCVEIVVHLDPQPEIRRIAKNCHLYRELEFHVVLEDRE